MSTILRVASLSSLLIVKAFCQVPLTPDELKGAKAFDADLAKQCRASEEQCRRAYSMLLIEAQVRLAEWGYGVKFSGESDALTLAAIRLYQQRTGLPSTGKVDGATVELMDRDEKAVEAYPFTLPPFYFAHKWPSSGFMAMGVFRDTATGSTSVMDVKEWTGEHIIAEAPAACYTNQLRIERASKTVITTTIKTRSDGPCKDFEDKILKSPLASVNTEELVDGVAVQVELSRKRAAAVQRVKLFTGAAQSLVGSGSSRRNGKQT